MTCIISCATRFAGFFNMQHIYNIRVCSSIFAFQEKMTYLSSIVLLTAALSIVFLIQTVAAVKYCSSHGAKQDAQVAMKKCNSEIKFCFLRYQDRHPQHLYCKGMLVRFILYNIILFLSNDVRFDLSIY